MIIKYNNKPSLILSIYALYYKDLAIRPDPNKEKFLIKIINNNNVIYLMNDVYSKNNILGIPDCGRIDITERHIRTVSHEYEYEWKKIYDNNKFTESSSLLLYYVKKYKEIFK